MCSGQLGAPQKQADSRPCVGPGDWTLSPRPDVKHSPGPHLSGGCDLQSLPARCGSLSQKLQLSVEFGDRLGATSASPLSCSLEVEWEGGREAQETEMQECVPLRAEGDDRVSWN